jgi:hypothetical protein
LKRLDFGTSIADKIEQVISRSLQRPFVGNVLEIAPTYAALLASGILASFSSNTIGSLSLLTVRFHERDPPSLDLLSLCDHFC